MIIKLVIEIGRIVIPKLVKSTDGEMFANRPLQADAGEVIFVFAGGGRSGGRIGLVICIFISPGQVERVILEEDLAHTGAEPSHGVILVLNDDRALRAAVGVQLKISVLKRAISGTEGED